MKHKTLYDLLTFRTDIKIELSRLVKRLAIAALTILAFFQYEPVRAAGPPKPPVVLQPSQLQSDVTFGPELLCTINDVSANTSLITLSEETATGQEPARLVTIPVLDDLRNLVKQYHAGDHVIVRLRSDTNGLASLRPQKITIDSSIRLYVLAAPVVVIILVYVVLRIRNFSMSRLILGKDGRYSNSKFQMTIWLFVVVSVYFASYCLRAWYGKGTLLTGPGIPLHLGLLTGISGATYCGAKAITSSKIEKEMAAIEAKQRGGPPAPPPGPGGASLASQGGKRMMLLRKEAEARVKPVATSDPHIFSDLFKDDHDRPDLGDTQMVVLAVLASFLYLFTAYEWLGTIDLVHNVTLPDIDSTILTFFGLGQGAYLVKKNVGNGA